MSETTLSNAPSPQTEQPTGKARLLWSRLGRIFLRQREASVFAVVVVLFIYFGISNANFVSIQNVGTIAQFVAPVAIVATGEVFLLICGEIDISVGSVFAFAPFVMYLLNQDGIPMWLSMILALLVSMGVGLVNGLATVWLKIPSLITTLGTQFLVMGITLTVSMGEPVIPSDEGILNQIFGLSQYSEIIWAIVLMVIFQIVLSFTRWGVHTVAAGGNLLGASEAGVAVNRIKIVNFMIVSLLGGLTGIMEGFRIQSFSPLSGGTTLMFSAVAGAVIGGTALNGGIGTVFGAFLGVLALQTLYDGFTLQGVSAYVFDIILGVAILIAMLLNQRIRFWREGRH